MRKEPLPTTNLLTDTISHQNKFKQRIERLPKAKNYRKQLEPLLGSVCTFVCDTWSITPDTIDGNACDRIYMKDALVVKAPKSRGVELPVTVHHIWTAVDPGWKSRNNAVSAYGIKVQGFVYLYNSKGKKNIGLQALSVRLYQKE